MNEDDVLLQIETDKVTIDVRYTESGEGTLKEMLVKADDTVSVGQEVAVVAKGKVSQQQPSKEEQKPAEPKQEAATPPKKEEKPAPQPPKQPQQSAQPKQDSKPKSAPTQQAAPSPLKVCRI